MKGTKRKQDVKGDVRSGSAALYPFCKGCDREIKPGEVCLSYVSKYLHHTMFICSDCLKEKTEK